MPDNKYKPNTESKPFFTRLETTRVHVFGAKWDSFYQVSEDAIIECLGFYKNNAYVIIPGYGIGWIIKS